MAREANVPRRGFLKYLLALGSGALVMYCYVGLSASKPQAQPLPGASQAAIANSSEYLAAAGPAEPVKAAWVILVDGPKASADLVPTLVRLYRSSLKKFPYKVSHTSASAALFCEWESVCLFMLIPCHPSLPVCLPVHADPVPLIPPSLSVYSC
jgi:hypothetical protein